MRKFATILVAGVLSGTVGGVAHAAQADFKCRILDTYNPHIPVDSYNQNIPYEFHISIEIPDGQTRGRFYRVGHFIHNGRNSDDGTMTGRADILKTPTGIKFYRVNWWTAGGPAMLSITLDGAHSSFNITREPAQTKICAADSFRPIPAPLPAKR